MKYDKRVNIKDRKNGHDVIGFTVANIVIHVVVPSIAEYYAILHHTHMMPRSTFCKL